MYDYAPFMKRKYAALTQNIEIHHYSISPNSRDNTSLFKRIINRKGQETNHYNDYLLFSPLFLSDPDIVFAYIMLIIKRKTEKERKRWLAISAISDLKLAKRKYYQSGVFIIRRRRY
jgi:hypothetical protein